MTGLTIRRFTSLKYKLFITSVAVFALVAQPLYGALSAQVANAVASSATNVENSAEIESSIQDNSTSNQVVSVPPADTTAPAVTAITQVYEEKENGRIAVTLTFSEGIGSSLLGQGWSEVAGSGKTQFTKRYYSTKEHTVTFNDLANNQGTYTFTVDKTAPTVLQATQAFENHTSGPRVNVTLTFSEAINLASLPQGWYEVTGSNKTKYVKAFYSTKTHVVTFADLTGNAGTFTLSVDSTIPAAPVLSLSTAQGEVLTTGGFTNKSDVVATWTKPAGDIAKYEYAYWNNIPSSPYNTENKAWMTSVADITRAGAFDQGEGTHYIKVRAYSPSGNISNWSNVFEVTYDKTPPTDFAITLADGRSASGATIGGEQTFTFTQAEANPKSIYIEYMEKNSNGNWAKKLGKEVLGTNAAALAVNTNAWSEGLHQVKVSTKDAAGNATSTTTQFTVDNIPPSIAVKDGFKGNKTERVFREVSFSLYDTQMLEKYVINQHASDFTNNKWSDANFQNIKQYLVQGENTLELYDVAGNVAIYKFIYDTVAPQTPVHATPFDGIAQKSNDFWFEWNDVEGAVSYEMQNSQNSKTGSNGSFTDVQWTGDYQQIQPTESKARSVGASGTWYWQVRAVDAAGNKSSWTQPWKVTIDQQAPAATNVTVTPSLTKQIDGPIALNVAINDQLSNIVNAKYTLYKEGETSPVSDAYKNVALSGTYGVMSGEFTQSIDTSTLASGTYRIQLHFTDAAGNQGERTASFVINNSIAVMINPVASSSAKPVVTGAATWEIGGAAAGQALSLQVKDSSGANVGAPLTTTIQDDGTWAVTVPTALVNGTYSLIANAGSGSMTGQYELKPVVINVVAPVTTSPGTSPSNGQNTGSGTTGSNIPQVSTASSSTPISPLLPAASLFSATAPTLTPSATSTIVVATDAADDTVASVQGLSTVNSNESDDAEGEVKAAEDIKASWSLGNLVLTAISVIAGLMALLGVFRKRETDEMTHTALRAVVIMIAAGTVIAYLLTNDFVAPMAWFSVWSIAYAVAAIAQISIIANLKGSTE